VPITEPLQLLHADTAGRISTSGGLGEQDFITLLDDFTGYKIVVCVKSKAEIPAALIAELNKLMNRTGREHHVLLGTE
jgi:hypothetical protein